MRTRACPKPGIGLSKNKHGSPRTRLLRGLQRQRSYRRPAFGLARFPHSLFAGFDSRPNTPLCSRDITADDTREDTHAPRHTIVAYSVPGWTDRVDSRWLNNAPVRTGSWRVGKMRRHHVSTGAVDHPLTRMDDTNRSWFFWCGCATLAVADKAGGVEPQSSCGLCAV